MFLSSGQSALCTAGARLWYNLKLLTYAKEQWEAECMGKAQTSAFQNRELSWLQFNRRVQAEADQPKNPLLERAKFLAIVTSNLDVFMLGR